MMAMSPAISTNGLDRRFGRIHAVGNFTVTVERGVVLSVDLSWRPLALGGVILAALLGAAIFATILCAALCAASASSTLMITSTAKFS
jgi:hypothetical protein